MVMFHSYVSLPESKYHGVPDFSSASYLAHPVFSRRDISWWKRIFDLAAFHGAKDWCHLPCGNQAKNQQTMAMGQFNVL